jgi:hypothetical protein
MFNNRKQKENRLDLRLEHHVSHSAVTLHLDAVDLHRFFETPAQGIDCACWLGLTKQ